MSRTDSPLIAAARQWVVDHYPYNSRHLTQSLAWLDRIAPEASEAVRLATLTHDMERAFPGPEQPLPARLNDPEYERAHSERSARTVGAWLREHDASPALVADVEALIRVHEVGGSPDANLVQAADRASFLETNIDLFLGFGRAGKYPLPDIGSKFDESYERIQVDEARALARPLWTQARARLAALEAELQAGAASASGPLHESAE